MTKEIRTKGNVMGMAASQARFLGLTARKTNVEYEGQQVNQQRTMLSNQSANYYNQLLGMTVPVPPSVDDYTKTVYSFNDGALNNTLTSLVAQQGGAFLISYNRTYTDSNAIVSTVSSIVTRTGSQGNYHYAVGNADLRDLSKRTLNPDGTYSYTTVPEIQFDPTTNEATYTGKDEYLKSLDSKQLGALVVEESMLYEKLNDEKYNGKDGQWQVYYKYNSTSNEYTPVYYNKFDLEKDSTIYSDKTGASQSYIPAFTIGTAQVTDEVKGVNAKMEQDASGRYISITLDPGTDQQQTYALTTATTTDQNAYDDAMNQYEFDKATYDKSIEDINAKIEVVQAQDKNLELRLKQLDTEQDAIQTEMDAVQKVIEKNVESTFKTFG